MAIERGRMAIETGPGPLYRRVLAATALALAAVAAHAGERPRVELLQGAVVGVEAGGVRSYKGIPYAAPPVQDRRWTAPQTPPPWTAPLDASSFGPACPQGEDRFSGQTPPVRNEDCLYLNVWAPAQAEAPLPVMVWIHGGANRIGAASLPYYDGARLAARGAVVVSFNYRLGYLGFFAHPALAEEGGGGNFALMDQIAALRWVRNEIAKFGGDPARVTVFGQSAGGADILYLMTSPAASRLFQRAIVQSGGGWVRPLDRKTMARRVVRNLGAVGVGKTTGAVELRALPAERLLEAQRQEKGLGFGPFLDGATVFEAPHTVFSAGRQATVPLLIGSTDWEANLLEARGGGGMRGAILARMPPAYGWYDGRADGAAQREALLFTDIVFGAPARWVAAQHAARAPAYLYRFTHVTRGRRGEVPGAGHGAEIPYVFDTLGTTSKSAANAGADDLRLARGLADCWVAFAATGAPACALADWHRYDPSSDRLLLIDGGAREVPVPDAAALDGVQDWFGPGAWMGP